MFVEFSTARTLLCFSLQLTRSWLTGVSSDRVSDCVVPLPCRMYRLILLALAGLKRLILASLCYVLPTTVSQNSLVPYNSSLFYGAPLYYISAAPYSLSDPGVLANTLLTPMISCLTIMLYSALTLLNSTDSLTAKMSH